MATIGQLVISLEARTAKMEAALNKMRRDTRRTAQQMERGFAGVARSLRQMQAVAAATATALATGFIARQIQAADAIGKTADRLGLTVERLQEFRIAADRAGVSQQTFDMGFQRFVRRTEEAAHGTGEAVAALRELGFTQQQLASSTPEQRFLATADALSRVESQADRVRLAFKLFDSEGVAFVNILRDGSQGIDQASSRARRLGLVLRGNLVRSAEAANDVLSELRAIIGVRLQEAVLRLAPAIASMADRLPDIADSIERIVKAFADRIERVIDFFKRLNAFINRLQNHPVYKWLTSPPPSQLGGDLPTTDEWIQRLFGGINKMVGGKAPPKPTRIQVDIPGPKSFDTSALAAPVGLDSEDIISNQKRINAKILEEADRLWDGIRSRMAKAHEVAERMETPFAKMRREVREIRELSTEFPEILSPEAADRAIRQIERQFVATTAGFQLVVDAGRAAGQAINTTIDSVIRNTQSLSDAFKNLARNIALALGQSLISTGVGIASSSLIGLITGGKGGAGKPALPSLEKKQHGGVVTGPELALLGENPTKNPEFVLNRQQMQGMLSGKAPTVIVVFDQEEANRRRAQAQAEGVQASVVEVTNQILAGSGSPINRAIAMQHG